MKRPTILSLCIASLALVALPISAATGNVKAGEKLYQDFCQSCHGEKGEGNPAAYKKAKAKIVHLGSEEAQAKTDDSIRKVMTEGFGKMDKVEDLENAQQVEDVLAFVRTLRLKPPSK